MPSARRRVRRRIRRQWRWAVVGAFVAVLVALPSVVAAWPVPDPHVELSALIDRIEGSAGQPLEGLFESRGGVHLPDLGRYDDEVAAFAETTRVRVFYAAPNRWRADELSAGGENGWYREPGGLWRWRTGRQDVVFSPRPTEVAAEPARFPRSMDLSPTELGRRIVQDAEQGNETIVAIGAQRIAGHIGAGLRITPADPTSTTISSIDVWADASTGVVLRVHVHAGSSVPILETGYLDLSLRAPSASTLSFDPAATDVVYRTSATMDAVESLVAVSVLRLPDRLAGLDARGDRTTGVRTYGSGLTIVTVVAFPDGVLGRRIGALPSSTRPWGGDAVVVEAGLVNLEVVEASGLQYVVAGTVPVGVLDDIAAQLTGASGAPG